jgi:hypothetical protein
MEGITELDSIPIKTLLDLLSKMIRATRVLLESAHRRDIHFNTGRLEAEKSTIDLLTSSTRAPWLPVSIVSKLATPG